MSPCWCGGAESGSGIAEYPSDHLRFWTYCVSLGRAEECRMSTQFALRKKMLKEIRRADGVPRRQPRRILSYQHIVSEGEDWVVEVNNPRCFRGFKPYRDNKPK